MTYTQAEAIDIINTEPDGDTTYILAHQFIAASLNILNGADPSVVTTTISEADSWFSNHPIGSNPSNPDREQAIIETMQNRGLCRETSRSPTQK